MKNIVFLVGPYYPYFSAVGTCCFNIAGEMAKSNKVTVISPRTRIGEPDIENYNNQKILRVSYRWYDYRLQLTEKIKKSGGIQKGCYSLLLNIVRTKEYLNILLSKTSINRQWLSSYKSAFDKINEPIDVIIPFCSPMEAVVAGMNYKRNHSSVQLMPYLFDHFVESLTLHRTAWNKTLKRRNNSEIEIDMLNLSDAVFCVDQLKGHFSEYYQYQNKLIFTEHPLLKEIEIQKEAMMYEGDKTNLIYTGVFDKKIRNPEFLLTFISLVLPKIDLRLHLYTFGNCGQIIKKHVKQSHANIINHGTVSKNEANQAAYSSDILICAGNINDLQVPSKIFEYMSVGKPIVHFYQFDNDANIRILEDYPLSLCLKQDNARLVENTDKFIRFCRENKDKSLAFTEVEKIYFQATPKYIAGRMTAFFNGRESPNNRARIITNAGK